MANTPNRKKQASVEVSFDPDPQIVAPIKAEPIAPISDEPKSARMWRDIYFARRYVNRLGLASLVPPCG